MSAARNTINKTLRHKLIELIRLRGPITISDYMKIVLTNPESGFYTNQNVFGVKGHFTTNPEISQIFGEVLGVWILNEWRRFGSPKPLRLVEFGPGRGTLMLDLLRTFKNFGEAPQVQLIEISPKLQAMQSQAFERLKYPKPQWLATIDAVEKRTSGFDAFIAHEFLDALPIHKFVRDTKTKAWRELLVDYDQKEQLRFCISHQPSLSTRLLIPEKFQGDHLEVCPEAALQLEKVSDRLNSSHAGCMIVCDYGFEEEPQYHADETMKIQETVGLKPIRSNRDTFRAFKNHESWPPLKDPGEADLTADVDFGYLKKYLSDKALLFGSVDQKTFLIKCSLEARLEKLIEEANEDERQELISSVDMLTNDMGYRYRFLAMFPKGSQNLFDGNPPAGFD